MRAILIRDPNKMIAAAVLSSPKLNDAEIEGFCADGERPRRSVADHRQQSRVDEELQRGRRSHEESENAARPLAQSDGATERSRRRRPSQAIGTFRNRYARRARRKAALGRATSGEPKGSPLLASVAFRASVVAQSDRICASPSM